MATAQEGRKVEKVEHNYMDHAHIVEESLSGASKPANASDRHFPVKMHYMLAELEQDGLDHIVSWQPHGRAFVVHNQAEFVRTILPTWFRQTKFASFQRQLNLYGFKRLTTGRDKNGYYHELFLRGKRFLAHRIPRCKLKGQGARKPTSPETEPNFYLYSFLPLEQSNDRSSEVPQAASAGMRLPSLSLEQILLNDAAAASAGGIRSNLPGHSRGGVPTIGQLTGQLALPNRSLFQEVLAASLTRGNRMFMDQGHLPFPPIASTTGNLGSQRQQQLLIDQLSLRSQQFSAAAARGAPALSDLLNADLALRMALARDLRSPSNANRNPMK